MKAPQNRGKYAVMAEINMIPLIDVSLVLLIIFMVMTPFLVKSQIRVNLPRSKAADSRITHDQMLQIQVRKDGAIFVNGQAVDSSAVESTLRHMITDPDGQPVMVEADKDVPFQHVVVVLDAAKRIGTAKVGVCVRQEDSQRPAGKKR